MIHEKIKIQLKDSEFKANLFTYFLDNSPEIDMERKRPVVLICPGGGYRWTSGSKPWRFLEQTIRGRSAGNGCWEVPF